MFELKKSKQYRAFPKPQSRANLWSAQLKQTLLPPRQLYQVHVQKKLVFECFVLPPSSPQTFEREEGLYILTETAICFVAWDAKVVITRPRKTIAYVIQGANGQLFGLTKDSISRISHRSPHLLQRICAVPKLHNQLPSEVKLTCAAVYQNCVFLSTWQKMFIVSTDTCKVVQSLMIFEGIKEMHISSGKLLMFTQESQFEIAVVTASEPPPPAKPSPPALLPDTIIALGREAALHIASPLDILWAATTNRSRLEYVKKQWRLDPLDRTYLHSKDFYQDFLFAYMNKEVKMAALVLYLEEPSSLRLLREALREQEENLRIDGLLRAEQSISEFLLSCLPPLTGEERPEQLAIRDELGSKSQAKAKNCAE